jgi:hypothetical protein
MQTPSNLGSSWFPMTPLATADDVSYIHSLFLLWIRFTELIPLIATKQCNSQHNTRLFIVLTCPQIADKVILLRLTVHTDELINLHSYKH